MQPSFWITVLLSIVLARSLPLGEAEASPAGNSPNWITNTAGQDPSSRRQLPGLPIPIPEDLPLPPVNPPSSPTPPSSAPSSASSSTPSSSDSQTSPKPNILKRANKSLPQQVAPPHTTLSRRQIDNITSAMTRVRRSPAPSARAIKLSRKVELKAPVAPPAPPTNPVSPHHARGVALVEPSLPVNPPVNPSAPSPRDVAAAPALPVVTPPSPPVSPPASSPRDVVAAPDLPDAPALPAAAPSPPSPSPRDVPAASSESVKTSSALVDRQLRAADFNSAGPQADDSASGSEDAEAHAEEEATPANKKHDTHNALDHAKERRYGGSPEWIANSDLGETSDESKRSLTVDVPINGKKQAEEAHENPSEHGSAVVERSAARLIVGRMEQMVKVQ